LSVPLAPRWFPCQKTYQKLSFTGIRRPWTAKLRAVQGRITSSAAAAAATATAAGPARRSPPPQGGRGRRTERSDFIRRNAEARPKGAAMIGSPRLPIPAAAPASAALFRDPVRSAPRSRLSDARSQGMLQLTDWMRVAR
jgi:hypothetical protein